MMDAGVDCDESWGLWIADKCERCGNEWDWFFPDRVVPNAPLLCARCSHETCH